MLFNYAISNMDDYVVLGTGNKTELLLGYFTKYGDGGADFLPIGDLYKTQVRQMACHIQIPGCVVEKAPSAGLWLGQTDEEELGESYENIDRILFLLNDKKYSVDQAASALNLERKAVENIKERVVKNAHKRIQPPVVALG
jgi:NAD+ synthase